MGDGSAIETGPTAEPGVTRTNRQQYLAGLASLGLLDITALAVVLLFPIVSLSGTPYGPTSARIALLVLTIPVGIWCVKRAARAGDCAARWMVLLAAVVVVSAALSRHPLASIVGDITGRTSALVLIGYVACWGLGRRFDAPRRTMGDALLLGGTVQLAVVLGQMVFLHQQQPYGFTGNSIFAAAILAATAVVMAQRAMDERRWAWALASVPFWYTVSLLGSRAAMAGALIGLAMLAWRHPIVLLAGVIAVLAVLGVASAVGSQSVGARLARHSQANDLSWRADVWRVGLDAWTDRPLLGWGPGRFLEATGPRMTAGLVRRGPIDTRFADAHNLLVEYLVTLGIPGLAALLAAVWLALSRGSGEARLVVVVLLVFHLFEPQSLAVTPVLFVFLGASLPVLDAAARSAEGPNRWITGVVVAFTALALVEGALVLVCDVSLARGQHQASTAAFGTAASVEPLWGTPAAYLSGAWVREDQLDPSAHARSEALDQAGRAVSLDPTSPQFLYQQAELELQFGSPQAALRRFEHADRVGPWYPQILAGLKAAAGKAGAPAVARRAAAEICLLDGRPGRTC